MIGLMALTALTAAAETLAGAGIDHSCERWTADQRQDGVTARQDEQWVFGYLSAVADWTDIDPMHMGEASGPGWTITVRQILWVKITEAASAFVREIPASRDPPPHGRESGYAGVSSENPVGVLVPGVQKVTLRKLSNFNGAAGSQERRSSMFLEQVHPPHVATQRVQRLVPADRAEFPDACPRLGSARQKPAAQAVAGVAICAALLLASRPSETRPPSATARNSGPDVILAASVQIWTASTGRRR
jgi:hypothetical protein